MQFNISAFKMVPEGVKSAARQVSEFLTQNNIPHAVIGGMAVSAYSPPRMTEDVDFLVPDSAMSVIQEMGPTTALADAVEGITLEVNGVIVDFIFMPEEMPEETLDSAPRIDGIPVLRQEALLLMKMHAPRAKDQADAVEMIKAGLIDMKAVKKYFQKYDPSMLDDLESLTLMAEVEKNGAKTKTRPKMSSSKKPSSNEADLAYAKGMMEQAWKQEGLEATTLKDAVEMYSFDLGYQATKIPDWLKLLGDSLNVDVSHEHNLGLQIRASE